MNGRLVLVVVVAIALIAAGCTSDSDDPAEVLNQDAATETTVATTTSATTQLTTASQIEPTTTTSDLSEELSTAVFDAALIVADDYFESSNARDAAGVMALMAPNAAFGFRFTDSGSLIPVEMASSVWEQRLAWNMAQGTATTSHECAATDPNDTSITVSCSHGTLDAISQSVDGPAVPTETIFTITADGISKLVEEYGEPDFKHVAVPFTSWMMANHPSDMSSVEFGSWSTIEEARQVGESVAAFSQRWADYLTANGCNYLDNC